MTSRWLYLFTALALAPAVTLGIGAGSAAAGARACPSSNRPNTLVLTGGSGQIAQLGKAFPTNFEVALANTNGCPLTGNLAGVNIAFVAPGAGASGLFPSSGSGRVVVGTNGQGIAIAPTFIANHTAGSYSVDAQSDYGSVNFYLTNTASGLAASITAAGTTSQEATVNSVYAQPLQARVLDADGKPVQGATVTFSILTGPTGAGGSFLGQATATTDSDGLATSPPLLANAAPGRFTAAASTDDLSAIATFNLDNHAAASTIAATRTSDPPPTATVGTRYPQPLTATVLDANGQPIEGASVTFTITQAENGAGAGFLGGTTQANALTDAAGRATSPSLVANKTAGRFAATATVAGAATPVTYTLRNLAGPAHTVAAGAATGESTATGSRFPIRLAVTVTDEQGNPLSGVAIAFTAPARGPSGYFTRGRRAQHTRIARVKTNANGIAVAPPFTANGTSGGYVVVATARGSSKRAAFALRNVQP